MSFLKPAKPKVIPPPKPPNDADAMVYAENVRKSLKRATNKQATLLTGSEGITGGVVTEKKTLLGG